MHETMLVSEDVRSFLADVARVVVGAVWLVAGVAKLRAPAVTRTAVRQLVGMSGWIEASTARLLPIGEIALGSMLLLSVQVRPLAYASAALFVVFAVLIGRALILGSLAGGGCGCFGSAPSTSEVDPRAGSRAIARNLILAMLAVVAASAG